MRGGDHPTTKSLLDGMNAVNATSPVVARTIALLAEGADGEGGGDGLRDAFDPKMRRG